MHADESETSSDALSILGMQGRAKQNGLNDSRKRLVRACFGAQPFLFSVYRVGNEVRRSFQSVISASWLQEKKIDSLSAFLLLKK